MLIDRSRLTEAVFGFIQTPLFAPALFVRLFSWAPAIYKAPWWGQERRTEEVTASLFSQSLPNRGGVFLTVLTITQIRRWGCARRCQGGEPEATQFSSSDLLWGPLKPNPRIQKLSGVPSERAKRCTYMKPSQIRNTQLLSVHCKAPY